MKELLWVKEQLEKIIDRCSKAEYSLDDCHQLQELAQVLREEAKTLAECCS